MTGSRSEESGETAKAAQTKAAEAEAKAKEKQEKQLSSKAQVAKTMRRMAVSQVLSDAKETLKASVR